MHNVKPINIKQIEKFTRELVELAELYYYKAKMLEKENKRLKRKLNELGTS